MADNNEMPEEGAPISDLNDEPEVIHAAADDTAPEQYEEPIHEVK